MLFNRARKKKSRIWLTGMLDAVTPKIDDSIVLVAKRTYGYSGNLRVVGDYLATHSSKPIYLYFEGQLDESLSTHLQSAGIAHLDEFNRRNMHKVLSSKTLIVDHSIRDCYINRPRNGRKVINLWHGVPIKRIEMAIPGIAQEHLQMIAQNACIYDLMVSSSRVDQMAISSTFHVPYYKVLPFGLPRYDLFFSDLSAAPDLQQQQQNIEKRKGDKKLVLYAPTFRQHHPSPCVQNQDALRRLATALAPMGYQLGIRSHQYDKSSSIFKKDDNIVIYNSARYSETNVVLRNTDILITDFSSLWVDYLLMNKPIIGFATDLVSYRNEERNFLYDLDDIFPGPFLNTEESLISTITQMIESDQLQTEHVYQKKLFLPNDSSCITPKVCKAILSLK